MLMRSLLSTGVVVVVVAACAPSNPFDPDAPAELQQKARIVGHLQGDITKDPALLTVLDARGQPLVDSGTGAVAQFPTLVAGAPLPDGLDDAPGKSFQIGGLQPGTYTVKFDAALNAEPLFLDALAEPAKLLPGDVAVRNLAPQRRDLNDVPGSVNGSVDGAEGGASFLVRLVSEDRNPELGQLAFLSDNGDFSFKHVAAGSYRVEATGDDYAPTSTAFFQVADGAVDLAEPLHLTTLGRVFAIDDFEGHPDRPPFSPFLNASPAHVAVAPLVFVDPSLTAFARVYTDDTRPGPEDAWQALGGGADVLAADYEVAGGDGPRTLLAQLRVCFGGCTCADPNPDGTCADPAFQTPLVSREIPLDFVFDATPPRAVNVSVDDVARTVFDVDENGDLVAGHVPVNCARFGDVECAAASLPSENPVVAGDLVDDTSRVHGFFITLDDDAAPTQFTPLGTLGQLARVQAQGPAVDKAGPATRTLRLWAEDAAGNVGLVDVRSLDVDVAGVALDSPALVATAGVITQAGAALVPGASVTVDVAVPPASGGGAGEQPASWRIENQGAARAQGAVVAGTIPYTGPEVLDVTGADGQALQLLVDAFDGAGNLTRTTVPVTLTLTRTGELSGDVSLENRADVTGASVSLVNAAGATVITVDAGTQNAVDVGNPQPVAGAFNLDGAYAFTGVPVGAAGGAPIETYTVVARGPAPFLDGSTAVTLTPATSASAAPVSLLLPRGSLVGRFVLEGRESALTNSGIQVTLVDSLGDDVASALTFADGTWRVAGVPADTGYLAVAFFDGFIESDVPGIEVVANRESVVDDDGTGKPTPVVLAQLSGDFRLCAAAPVLDPGCTPLQFTNLTTVNVGGLSFDGIAKFRVSTTPFQETDVDPPFVDVTPATPSGFVAPSVTLGPSEGKITVFLQLQPTQGSPGPVLQSQVVFDTTPPQSVTATVARGTAALVDGFTNEAVGRVTVHADPGSGNVAPLKDARVVFAASAPASAPAQTACPHDTACAVPFENDNEGKHTAFAFSCDQAGNCSATPASADVVVDRTPPALTDGVSFAPSSSFIVSSGGTLFSRSAQFDIAVQTGHNNVADAAGNAVAGVFGTRFGLSPVVDDGTFRVIPAPSPSPDTARLVPGVALPPVDGSYTIFGQLTDAAGNASSLNSNSFHVDIVLDTRGPAVTFTLDAGAAFTNDPVVTLGVNDQGGDAAKVQLNTTGVFVDTDPSTFDERDLPLADTAFDLSPPAPPAGDGQVTVFGRFFDAAGNLTERSAVIFLDRQAPGPLLVDCASCTQSSGASFTNAASHQVVLDTLAADNSGSVATVTTTVRKAGLSGLPQTASFSGTQTVTLSVLDAGGGAVSDDGDYVVDVVFTDEAGNDSAPVSLPITLDTTAPAPALAINGAIGASAAFTRSENVSLTIDGGASTAPITGIRVQNTAATFSGLPQPVVPNLQWQLANPAVDENKLVFLEATDAAGNVGVTSRSIILDKTSPTGTVSIEGGAARINSTVANVSYAYTLSDVAAFAVTTAASGFPADCGGVTFTSGSAFPSQVTFASTSGGPEARTVSVCTRDAADNTALATATTVLDEEFPTGSVTLNGGATFTTTRALTATVSAPADTALIKSSLSGPGTVTPLDCASATGYVALPSPPDVTLTIPGTGSAGAGLYTAQVCLKDSAGNVSTDAGGNPAPVSDTIVFDAAAPSVTLAVNNGDAFTTNATVSLTVGASDDLTSPLGGVVSMRIANTTATFTGAQEPFTTQRTTTLAAPTTEELKTVCVEVTDAAGRTASTCTDISLDLVGPTGTVAIARAVGNFSTAGNGVLSTTFRSDDPSIAALAFGQAPLDCASVPAASFVPLAVSTNSVQDVTVADGEGTRSVTGCFKAQSGLLTSTTDTVFVDPTDPPLAQPLAPQSGALVSTRKPAFSWAAVNGAVSYTLIVRKVSDQSTVLSQAGVTGLSFTPSAALPEVPLEWIVVARKASGRTSVVTFTDAPRVTPDATAPSAPTGLTVAIHSGSALVTTPPPCTVAQPCINDPFPTLSFTPGTDTGTGVTQFVDVALGTDVAFTSPLFSLPRPDGSAFDVPFSLGDGVYHWRVRAVDGAGNSTTSATSNFQVDRAPPTPPTIVPPQDPVSQTLASTIPLKWTNEGGTGALTYRFELTTDSLGFGAPLVAVTQGATTIDVKGDLVDGAAVRHIFRVAAIDALGNQSAFTTATFLNDTVAPCSVSSQIDLVGASGTPNGFTNSSVVTVQLQCIGDNPSLMQIGCDGDPTGKPFVSFANVSTCVLPPGQGAHTVAAVVSDAAGNKSATVDNSISVDTVAPTTPILATQNTFTNQAAFTVSLTSGSSDTNFDHHEFVGGTVSSFTPFAGLSFSVPLSAGDGANIVRVRGVDLADNLSPEVAVTITKDTTPPQAPIILGGGTTHFVNADTFTFSLDPSSPTAFDANFETYETASCTGSGCIVGAFSANPGNGVFTFNLAQDQSTTFAVRGRDKAGNVSGAAQIVVVEDSHNPRPVQLEPLPAVVTAGPPVTASGSRGPYVDVMLARSETNIAPAQIDPNFDHFEIRGAVGAFVGFVPVCDAPTALCPIPFTSDTGDVVDQTTIAIHSGDNIAGFRIPAVPGETNTFTLRSVDKAGNVSLETTVFTRDVTSQRVTNNAARESGIVAFGDKIAYIDDTTSLVHVAEAGGDALWGTSDDGDFAPDTAAIESFDDGPPARSLAMGPNMLFYERNSGARAILMRTAGADGLFASTGDNTGPVVVSSDGAGTVVDETKEQSQPSFWRDSLAWKQATSSSETDVIVRQDGGDGVFGDLDDTFAKIGAAGQHRLFPAVSGDNLAFLLCNSSNRSACPSTTPFELVVVNAGPDHRFGTGDDLAPVTLTQAVDIDAMRIELFTPGTTGRAACRNVVAYAGRAGPNKGVQVIATEPDGKFVASDVPVQVMVADALTPGGERYFSLWDNVALSSDGFAPPRIEVATGGPDGCLTRKADNVVFDSQIFGNYGEVYQNTIVSEVLSPTPDVSVLELGSDRPLWPRSEGLNTNNLDTDRFGVAFGGIGFYDLATRTMRVPRTASFEVEAFDRWWAYAQGAVFGGGTTTLFVRDRAVDEIFGTADDVERTVTGTHLLEMNNNSSTANGGPSFDVDENAVLWAGVQPSLSTVVPVLRCVGADGTLGTADDPELEVAGASPGPNYQNLVLSKNRALFQTCPDVACNSTTESLFVREVSGADPCASGATVTQLVASAGGAALDGERVAFASSDVEVIEAGADHKLATTSDNVTRRFFQPSGVSVQEHLSLSGDRVAWIDTRSQTQRVAVGDLADLSVRVLSKSADADDGVSIDGDVLAYGVTTAQVFKDDIDKYYFGVEPDLPQDFVNPGPTRLRCPQDDIYEENDSKATATPMNSGAGLNAIVCRNDPDRYQITAPANASGCTVHAHIHFVHAEGDVDMLLFNENNDDDTGTTAIASSTGTTNDEIINKAIGTAGGTFQVKVFGFGQAENTYDISTNVTCP